MAALLCQQPLDIILKENWGKESKVKPAFRSTGDQDTIHVLHKEASSETGKKKKKSLYLT